LKGFVKALQQDLDKGEKCANDFTQRLWRANKQTLEFLQKEYHALLKSTERHFINNEQLSELQSDLEKTVLRLFDSYWSDLLQISNEGDELLQFFVKK
jgi:hypothetical protein